MQNERDGITKKLRARYSMDTLLSNSERVVLQGQRGVTVYGCRKILLYSPCEIRLCLGRRQLSIRGEGLLCTCFSAGSVTIEGWIQGVLYEQNRSKNDN